MNEHNYKDVCNYLISDLFMKEVTKTFLSGRLSATLIIPIDIARRHGLDEPSHVIVEETDVGILIRRLELNPKANRTSFENGIGTPLSNEAREHKSAEPL
jgi:bifunctional DNA-binding transcriptional regulator/antitoxin component of YhaV-PrlF toxin-antitoxin module